MRKKEAPIEPIIFTAEQITAFSKRNFYDEYLALHPAEKVWADRATTNYAERKRCWAEQEKVRLGLAPDPSAYDRGFAEFADPGKARPPDQFDVLSKDWEPKKK